MRQEHSQKAAELESIMRHPNWSDVVSRLFAYPVLNALTIFFVWTFFLHPYDGYAYDPLDLVLSRPVDLSFLACLSWVFWTSPSSFYRRAFVLIFTIVLSQYRAADYSNFAITFLGYSYFLFVHAGVARLIGLRGWNCRFEPERAARCNIRFSLSIVLIAMSAIAVFSVASTAAKNSLRLTEFYLLTTGLAITTAFLQHAFTATSGIKKWIVLVGLVGLFTIMLVAGFRATTRETSLPANSIRLHGNGILYCSYWIDTLIAFSVSSLFVALFSLRAAWLRVEQQCRDVNKLDEYLPKKT